MIRFASAGFLMSPRGSTNDFNFNQSSASFLVKNIPPKNLPKSASASKSQRSTNVDTIMENIVAKQPISHYPLNSATIDENQMPNTVDDLENETDSNTNKKSIFSSLCCC